MHLMTNVVLKIWKGESRYGKWFLFPLLYCLSKVYGFCLLIRNLLYGLNALKVDEVPIPVLAVGNITMGGTGKTPLVEKLSQTLRKMGFSPGIITRGYKRKRKGTFAVDAIRDKAADVGDEAWMLAKKTKVPVVVGHRRALAIVEAMRVGDVNFAILDDGYQVKNLKKNIDVVVLKGGRTYESLDLFPLGPCREPIGRLSDADAILINHGEISQEMAQAIRGIPTFRMEYCPLHLYNLKHNLITHYNILKEKKILAFCGIGDDRSFFDLLRSLGARIVQEVSFEDHHDYSDREIEEIAGFKEANLIVTTEKDAVKVSGMSIPDNLFYLAIEVRIDREESFVEVIQRKLEADGIAVPVLRKGYRTQKPWVH